MAVVLEAYVNGVSTRKVDRLVEQLGIDGMTKDRVSALCRALDEQVELFRARPLDGAYPYLWLDAKQVKVRDRGRVVSKALVVAYAVHESGVREVIGLDIGEVESGPFWVEFLRSLKARGLDGVRLAISDQHEGLKNAIAACWVPWQRCTVHHARHGDALPPRSAHLSLPRCGRCNADGREQARERVSHVLERLSESARRCAAARARRGGLIAFTRPASTGQDPLTTLERVTRRSAGARLSGSTTGGDGCGALLCEQNESG